MSNERLLREFLANIETACANARDARGPGRLSEILSEIQEMRDVCDDLEMLVGTDMMEEK